MCHAGGTPTVPYARGRWTPQGCTEGLFQQMLENQDAQAGHRANELSQEDWDFLLRLQVEVCAQFPTHI